MAIGIQLLERLEGLHQLGYVHGDLKTQNILCTNKGSSNNQLFLIDYGLAINYHETGKELKL
jgi:vaccinia related kinase